MWRGFYVAPDVQYIVNPAYNRDRGPVVVSGFWLHIELRRRCRSDLYFATMIPGGSHVPFVGGKIEGGGFFRGQYSRITSMMGPFGAGSQFARLSGPGSSFWR